jgi:hypothetical protein
MRQVLLVWELFPEETKFYKLSLTEEEYQKILFCHNEFLEEHKPGRSQSMQEALDWLNIRLTQPDLAETQLEDAVPFELEGPMTVVVSGMLL